MSTAPKVKLLTQPMDMIYSALFEGDTTRLLPKITSFLVRLFGFFIFLDFFKYLESLKKNKTTLKLQTRRRQVSKWANKLVPSNGTYLCSVQGYMCRILTLGGKSLPGKRETSCEGYKKWLCMARNETSSGYMDEMQC